MCLHSIFQQIFGFILALNASYFYQLITHALTVFISADVRGWNSKHCMQEINQSEILRILVLMLKQSIASISELAPNACNDDMRCSQSWVSLPTPGYILCSYAHPSPLYRQNIHRQFSSTYAGEGLCCISVAVSTNSGSNPVIEMTPGRN